MLSVSLKTGIVRQCRVHDTKDITSISAESCKVKIGKALNNLKVNPNKTEFSLKSTSCPLAG